MRNLFILSVCLLLGGLPRMQAMDADTLRKAALPGRPGLSEAEQRKLDYFFYEGLNLKMAEKFDAAYDAFVHCLSIDPTAPAVLYELAVFYAQMNRPEESLDMLRRAVAYSSDNFTYRLALATMCRNLGMYGEAADEYRKLERDYPGKPELNYQLADALTQNGEIADAIKAYDALEQAVGMNEALSMQKYKLYKTLEQTDNAFNEIDRLAAKYPMEPRYQILLGDLYLEQNDTVKARSCYEKAHGIDPESPYYIVSMAHYYEATGNKEAAEREVRSALLNEKLDVDTKVGILSHYIARLQQSKQGTESANDLFKTLLEQHPEDTKIKQMYGSLLATQGKTDEARFQLQLVTEMEPENESAWQQLLDLTLRSEDIPEVVRICTRCRELFPESPEYYFYLGVAYIQQEKYDEALDTYREGLKIIPETKVGMKSDFYGQIGDIYYQIKNMPEAYKAYDEALKYNDKNAVVLNNYAYFLSLEKKDLMKAERMSALAVKIESGNATYLDTYAWIFFVQGNYRLAKIYIESALANDTAKSPELVEHYGDILFMTGEKGKAVEQWKKAKEMGKESDVLDRKIAEEDYIEEEGIPYDE